MAKFNASDLKKLFADYDRAQEKLAALEASLEEARGVRSSIVKKIHDMTGSKAFNHSGATLKLMIRPSEKEVVRLRNEGKPIPPVQYFFRAEGGQAIDV